MNKIGPDGTTSSEIFNDFSLFSLNNINIGQFAAKIIQGSNNTILGHNAGKLAVKVKDAIYIGLNAGYNIESGESNISIGNDNSYLPEINNSINIGNNYINSTKSITIGNNLINNSLIDIGYETSELKIKDSNINLNQIQIGNIINLGFNNNLNSNSISIGNYNSNININIGTSNYSINPNSIIIGNNIKNINDFSLNINNLICKYENDNNKIIYLGVGIYKNIPIIIGSVYDDNNINELLIKGSLNTNKIIIKNSSNLSITLKGNDYQNNNSIIYYLPSIPTNINTNLFLSVNKNGNLQWKQITNDMITTIITRGDLICNNIEADLIEGFGYFLNNININDKTTDDLNEGINNLYFNTSLISELLLEIIDKLNTDNIRGSLTSNIYYNEELYSSNFNNHINNINADDINTSNSRFYKLNDFYDFSLNNLLNISSDDLKKGSNNIFYSEDNFNNYSNTIINNLREGKNNLYYTNTRFQTVFNNYINNNGIIGINQGTSNLYYNSINVESNTNLILNNINADFFREGRNNLYYTNNRLLNYLNATIPSTDGIKEGNSNLYFKSISNLTIDSTFIPQGNSNIYYINDSNLQSRIINNTTTDIYKSGTSNIYLNESNIISQYQSYIRNDITTDNIIEKNNYKFITNNFYNNELNVNGFFKVNNISLNDNSNVNIDINSLEIIKDELSIGPLTEVIHVYDYNQIYFNNRLSNIDIQVNYDSNITNSNVPFIVIEDRVGINNLNPIYNLHIGTGNDTAFISKIRMSDSKGSTGNYGILLNTSNNEISGDDFIIQTRKGINDDFKQSFIIKNNSFVGIGNNNPQSTLHLNSPLLTATDITIKMTDNITGHNYTNGLSLSKNENHDGLIWNYENANLSFATNNIERLKINNNGNCFIGVPSSYNYNLLGYNQRLTLGGSGTDNKWGQFYIYDSSISDNNYLGLIFRADNVNNYCSIQSDKIGIDTNVPILLNPRGNNIGIGLYNPSEKLHVNGNIVASGNIISSFSDMRLKTKISELENPLEIISKLNGFKYILNDKAKEFGFDDNKIMIGLNAQEVKEIIPEVVSMAPFDMIRNNDEISSISGENYLSIQYERIIPYLIEAIKELKKENELLKSKIL